MKERDGLGRRARLIRGVGAMVLAALVVGGLAIAASAAAVSGEGLVEIDASVVGSGGSVCNVTLHLTSAPGVHAPARSPVSAVLVPRCNPASPPQTSSVTVAAQAGASILSIAATSAAALNENGIFGGDCGADGSVKIAAGGLSRCSLTLYALGGSFSLSGGRIASTHTVQVTERVVTNGAVGAAGDALTLLCDTSFRVGLISAGMIGQESRPTRACAQQGTISSDTGGRATKTDSFSTLTNLAVAAAATPTAGPRISVRDNFSAAGYVTSYGAGCSYVTGDGAGFAASGDPLTCTITHTYVGGSPSQQAGLLTVASTVATGTLCGAALSVSVTSHGQQTASSPAPHVQLARQCTGTGQRDPVQSGAVQLAVAPGSASLGVVGRAAGRLDLGVVWRGDCDPAGVVAIQTGASAHCTLSMFPLVASLDLGPGRLDETTQLVQVTERVVPPGGAASTYDGSSLCRIHLRLGLTSGTTLSPESRDVAVCGPDGPASVERTSSVFSVLASIDLSYLPSSGQQTRVGLQDDFSQNGYLTTYSDGCKHVQGGAAALDAAGNPLSCTITHTHVGGAVSSTDGLVEVHSSVVGPAGSVCDATLRVRSVGPGGQPVGPALPVTPPSGCHSRNSEPLASGSAQVVVPAGAKVLSVSTPSGLRRDGIVLGGDCAANGALRVHAQTVSDCTLTLYPLAGEFTVSRGGSQATQLLRVTERIVPSRSASPFDVVELLCGTRFQAGLVEQGALSARTSSVSACAQVRPSPNVGNVGATTTIAVSFANAQHVVQHFGVTDDFSASNYVTTFSGGCKALAGEVAKYVGGSDPLTCTITHTYIGPSAAPPTPASTTSVSCPVAPSVAAVRGTMNCAVTVSAPAGAPTPTGTVTVSPGNETCSLATNPCQVTVATGSTVGAQETVTASFPGQSGLTASSGTTNVTLTPRATALAMACQSMSAPQDGYTYDDQPITCVLTVTDQFAPGSFSPAGQVSATAGSDTEMCAIDTSTHSCMVTLNSGGLWVAPLTITSSYPGDGSEFAASANSEPITVFHG